MTPSPSAQPLEFVDIGVNLAHDSFDADRDAVIERARAVGVVQMVITGASLDSTRRALDIANAHPGLMFATAGTHPHHATELQTTDLPALEALAREPRTVAVGECGLDYFRNFSPRAEQLRAFHAQLEIAARVGKPVFLHQRDAHADFLSVLREHRKSLVGAIAHCFTAGPHELEDYLALDLAIGVTGWICDERRGAHLLQVVEQIPADKLLLETDGPYLLPRDLRPAPKSRRNEPMYLPHIAAVVARARRESLASLAASSTLAARHFFGLPTPAVNA